jgi:DNA primase
MALPPNFLDELRARTPLPAVIGRRMRLARSGRQWKGCCPFHGEKTPSFYVYDDHYHCFGCGAHGDAIGFVMQSQGTGFMEAVEQLAAEAGMDVPKPSPEAAQAERQRLDLSAVLDMAQAHYQRRLFLPEGRRALDYLLGRGLSEDTIRGFGLGWTGDARGGLLAEFTREGVSPDLAAESGLIRRDDETGRVFELFYNRVMFPIRDRRGRTISFGGRIMGDGQPKYVNGPETTLFSKRRNLYALDRAREAVRGGGTVVVVEGYMDVIALHQAGFQGAVAPLGTALTEEQLQELWRLSPAPVLCFDGDAAGGRAAARAAELVLPLLAADRSLKLARLAPAEDPDSLVRRQGASAFQAVLDAARPLSDVLYELLRQDGLGSTPEQRAAFRTRLEEAARRIPDKVLSGEYRRELHNRFFDEQRQARTTKGQKAPPRPHPIVRHAPNLDRSSQERTRILIAILLNHPDLLHEVDHAFAELDLRPPLSRLRDVILAWSSDAERLDFKGLMDHLTLSGLAADVEQVLAAVPVPLPACAAPAAMPAEALEGWWHIFGFLHVDRLREEVTAAQADFATNMVNETQNRLKILAEALNKVLAGEPDGVELVAV